MVLNLAEMELDWRLKWFFRPFQRTGMNVEDYHAQFCGWKEEMVSLSFPAEEEDYIDGFIGNLRLDIRLRVLSKCLLSMSRLIDALYAAKFEESMIIIEENLKQIKANMVFDEMPKSDSASKGSNDGVRYGKNAENGAYKDFMSFSVDIPCVFGYVAGAIESGSTKASPNTEFEVATMLTQVVSDLNVLDSEAYEVLDEMTKPFWTETKDARNMFDEMPGQIPIEFQDAETHGSKAEESQVNLKSNEQSLKTLEPWNDSKIKNAQKEGDPIDKAKKDEHSEEEKLKDMEIISPMASQVIETFTLYDPFTYLHVQNNRRSCPTEFELHLADLCSCKGISLANGNRKDDIMLLFDPGGRSCSLRVWSWRYLYFFDQGGQFERKAIASSETHKVYEIHSRTAKAHVNGVEQRFCLQCSRFHSLSEFDDGKRSCQKHLAVHNERRRKNHASLISSRRLIPSHSSANFLETSFAAAASFVCTNVLHPLQKHGSNNWNRNASDYSAVSQRNNNMYLCLLRTWNREDRFAPNWGRPFDNGRNIKLLSIFFISRWNYQVYFDKILDGLRIWSLKSYFIFYLGGLLEDNGWKIITTNVAASLVESVTWELGRRSPIVVFEYDDIDKVVEWTVFNHFSIIGKIYCATFRLLIQARIETSLLGRLVTWCQDIEVLGLLDEGCYSWWAHLGGLYRWISPSSFYVILDGVSSVVPRVKNDAAKFSLDDAMLQNNSISVLRHLLRSKNVLNTEVPCWVIKFWQISVLF